ncbi:hypothetical protein C0J52_01616 [Blattella germanica]|nr:hypothetical protein C0J52_01616 [Blattella germanica]
MCEDSLENGAITKTINLIDDEETITKKCGGSKAIQFITTLTVGFLTFTYGCGTGWLSPTLPILKSSNPITGDTPITEDESSWLSSLPFLGAIVASPIFSFICQYYGRKTAGYLTAVPAILSWALIAAADSMVFLFIARFLMGLTFGGIIVFKPMYVAEIAEDSVRGALVSFLPLICNVATLFTFALGPFVSIRTLALICLIAPIIFIFAMYWLPETPTYLISKGRIQEATKSMLWFRRGNINAAERDLQKVKDLLQKKTSYESSLKHGKELFFSRGTLRALTICIVVCIAQQFSGVYVVLNNCIDIMAMATTEISPEIAGIIIGATQIFGSIFSAFFMDRLGRRTLLLGSQIVMAICLGALGTYYYFQYLGSDMTSVAFVPVLSVSLYLFAVGIGLAPVTVVLLSELFHPDIRGIVTTIVTASIWSLAFLITKIYPLLINLLEMHGCYWAFAGVCVVCTIYTIFQIPETKNRINLSTAAYSMSLTWPTPSLPILKSGDPPITDEEESWLGSLVFIGAITAAPIFSYISQRYGRKMAGYSTVIPFIISWLLLIFFDSIPLYYVSRFIGGFASGGVLAFAPMYVGEIAEDNFRGALGTVRATVGNIAGIFFCAVGPLVSIADMAAISIIMPFIFAISFYWLPETPMYLMKVGKDKEAMEAMTWLRGGNTLAAEEELAKLSVVIEESKSKAVSIKDLLSSRGTRRGLLICVVLAVAQQLSGIYPIMNYCVSLFEAAGGVVPPTMASVIITSVQTVGSITTYIFLDLAGRRILIICSQIIMALSLGTLGIYFYLQEQNFDMTYVGFLPILCVAVYVLSLSIGLGSVTYVVMSEIFSPESRGLATTVTTTTIWTMAFITTRFYSAVVNALGLYGCYWLFASVCVASTIFAIFQIPETKNRSLESILRELNGELNANDVENTNTSTERPVPEKY